MHILIIEDDRDLCDALKSQLLSRNHTADCCHTGSEALYHAMSGAYDLILLDRMLPEIDGLSILRSIRQNHMVKPYAIEELLARIRALSRRPKDFSDHTCLSYLDIRFDPDTRTITCRDKEELLSKRKALLMEFFMRNPDKTLTREQIYSRVWGPDGTVEDGNLDTYIYFLRKHLLTLKSRACIQTVHGMGYRLEGNHVS